MPHPRPINFTPVELATLVPSAAVVKAQDEAKTNILAAVLAATTTGEGAATLTIASPIKGFYYCLAQAEALTGTGTAAQQLAGADTIEFTLTKWLASGFYQLLVSPVPLIQGDEKIKFYPHEVKSHPAIDPK